MCPIFAGFFYSLGLWFFYQFSIPKLKFKSLMDSNLSALSKNLVGSNNIIFFRLFFFFVRCFAKYWELEYQLNTDAKIKISHKICDYKIQHYFEQFCLDQLKNVLFKQHFYFIPFSENISANFFSQNYSTRSKSFVRKKLRGLFFLMEE